MRWTSARNALVDDCHSNGGQNELSNIFHFASRVAIIYAVGFLIIPRIFSGIYRVMPGPGAVLAFRYFGVALLGIGLIFWFARDVQYQDARRAILGGAAKR